MAERIIGIMGAMPEEIDGVSALLENSKREVLGMRAYTSGTINNIKTVVVFSRWGKVAAAATAATLIHHYKVTEIFFTGVAGAIDPTLKIGDIVIGKRLIQHDMDARPLMKQFEIPLLGITYLETDTTYLGKVKEAFTPLLLNATLQVAVGASVFEEFGIDNPNLHIGDIASGDRFFGSNVQKEALLEVLPTTLCVEMEGAAVAQVCFEHKIPFIIIRTISDTADEQSHIDFPKFIQNIPGRYAVCMIKQLFGSI